jgi:hypothetical protein
VADTQYIYGMQQHYFCIGDWRMQVLLLRGGHQEVGNQEIRPYFQSAEPGNEVGGWSSKTFGYEMGLALFFKAIH